MPEIRKSTKQPDRPHLVLVNGSGLLTAEGMERIWNALTGKDFTPEERKVCQKKIDALNGDGMQFPKICPRDQSLDSGKIASIDGGSNGETMLPNTLTDVTENAASNAAGPLRRRFNKAPATVDALENFGRVRLSKSFFMREFLYSEISQISGISNIPDDPELAIFVGEKLCNDVLEPIQEKLGRISIRSSFRSCAVNARGAENKNQYRCSSNEATYANHIWDRKDAENLRGATACIVVNSFIDYYERTKHWEALAWWIHENVPGYSDLVFYPQLAAFNISWHEKPKKTIRSFIPPRAGYLTKPDMANFAESHTSEYSEFVASLL